MSSKGCASNKSYDTDAENQWSAIEVLQLKLQPILWYYQHIHPHCNCITLLSYLLLTIY